MGVPGRRDLRRRDQGRRLDVAHPLSGAAEDLMLRSCSLRQPALGTTWSEVPGRPAPSALSQADPAAASDTIGFGQRSYRASIGCRNAGARRTIHLSLLLLVGFLLPSPASVAQPSAVRPGQDRSNYPAYGYPRGDGGAHGAYSQSRGDEPSFEYAMPSSDGAWEAGRAMVPTPGYTGYASPDAPGYGGFPGAGPPLPVFSDGGGSQQGGHPGAGVAQGGEGFRFRGDKAVSEGQWRESPSAPGYRFRPMNPEELGRSAGGDGWRPIKRDDRRAAEPEVPAPPGADAFGYQQDSWFRRYYGERP
jgi:hypothetical protein